MKITSDRPLPKELAERVAILSNGCWIWQGGVMPTGYGRIHWGGKAHYAHRVAYELSVGPIPPGFEVDHLCYTRLCVRPDHLEAVTPRENRVRARARIQACPKGHAYDEANTYHRIDRPGRQCKQCRREGMRRARD